MISGIEGQVLAAVISAELEFSLFPGLVELVQILLDIEEIKMTVEPGRMFAGVANTTHHYVEARAIADQVPEATLRMSPKQVTDAYPDRWRELLAF